MDYCDMNLQTDRAIKIENQQKNYRTVEDK